MLFKSDVVLTRPEKGGQVRVHDWPFLGGHPRIGVLRVKQCSSLTGSLQADCHRCFFIVILPGTSVSVKL